MSWHIQYVLIAIICIIVATAATVIPHHRALGTGLLCPRRYREDKLLTHLRN